MDICALTAALALIAQPCYGQHIPCWKSQDRTKTICAPAPDPKCVLPSPVTYQCKRPDGTIYEWQGE